MEGLSNVLLRIDYSQQAELLLQHDARNPLYTISGIERGQRYTGHGVFGKELLKALQIVQVEVGHRL